MQRPNFQAMMNPLGRDPTVGVTLTWDSGLEVRQLCVGSDLADPCDISQKERAAANLWSFGKQNANLVYLIIDRAAGEAVAVDAAFDIAAIRNLATAAGTELIGSVYTHRHFDHTGGLVPPGFSGRGAATRIEGAAEVLAVGGCVWVGEADRRALVTQCLAGGSSEGVFGLADGDAIRPSCRWAHSLRVLATPGHTAGSVALLVGSEEAGEQPCRRLSSFSGWGAGGALLTGDTLFQGNVGRVDSTRKATLLFDSLQKLKALPAATLVLPAHHYGFCTETRLESEIAFNTLFGKCKTLQQFVMVLGLPDDPLLAAATSAADLDGDGSGGSGIGSCACCRPRRSVYGRSIYRRRIGRL